MALACRVKDLDVRELAEVVGVGCSAPPIGLRCLFVVAYLVAVGWTVAKHFLPNFVRVHLGPGGVEVPVAGQ